MPSDTSSKDRQSVCTNILPKDEPFAMPAGDRVWQRHAHQKREARLDRVVQRAAGPCDVGLVEGQEFPEPVARKCPRDLGNRSTSAIISNITKPR